MQKAPLENELAEGPEGGEAFWRQTEDGIRVRIARWPGGDKGTIFLLPGRTEYVEKFGRAASNLSKRGYTCLSIDWRGQGLADRLLDDVRIGHVDKFVDYQCDLRAMIAMAREAGCPEPYYMLAHSMGGCIGLRALHELGTVFNSAMFSGPMWGIQMKPAIRPIARLASSLSLPFGFSGIRAFGSAADTYVLSTPFEGNSLTSDPDMFAYMRRHAEAMKGIRLIGPSLGWLHEALGEIEKVIEMGPARHEVVTYIGGNDKIIEARNVHQMMNNWENGALRVCPDSEHEIFIETPDVRKAFFDEADALFSRT